MGFISKRIAVALASACLTCCLIVNFSTQSAFSAEKKLKVVKTEPGKGKVASGVKILVDDGTCPSGKIKQITGGGDTQGRKRECVRDPRLKS